MTRILVIDDEPLYHKMIAHALENEKYQLDFAANGNEGLRKAKTNKPDLVITDVMMPDIDGYTVQSRMQESDSTRSIPILILTAKGQLKELFGMATNVVAYIEKPFDPKMLRDKITEIINKK